MFSFIGDRSAYAFFMSLYPLITLDDKVSKAPADIPFTRILSGPKSFAICRISFSSAALGTSVEVPSIDGGKSKIKIPPGTQHGKQFRLKGKGMPVLRRSVSGDLYIRVVTQVPTSLSKRQKEILEEFNVIESNKPDPVIKSFFEKAKKFWKSS